MPRLRTPPIFRTSGGPQLTLRTVTRNFYRRIASWGLLCLVLPALPTLAQNQATSVRVAAISFEPIKLDIASNAKQLEVHFRQAAAGGAQIAVAPEGILEGYIVNQIITGQMPADKMFDVAVTIDSPTIGRFQQLARELHMCLVFGFAERIGQEVFNTAVFVDHRGNICGKYHKMLFHEGYDHAWWFNRLGNQSRAFETPFGRCGMMICNDRWNPSLAAIPALDGAQFLVIPAFGSTSVQQDQAVLERAIETKLPVIEANVGVSLIVSQNRIVAVKRQQEGVTYGDIQIPPRRPIDVAARDRRESEFIQWRKTEMPLRLAKYLSDLDPRGPARDRDIAVLQTSQLEVLIGNNRSHAADGVTHRAGYNGIFSIRSKSQSESPFVPSYAGFNLEHYFDAQRRPHRPTFFEPRYNEIRLRRINDRTVELHQPSTPIFQVESWTQFTAKDPSYVDFTFRCTPHRDDYAGDFLGVFWASYINGPHDKSMYFLDGKSSLDQPLWRQLCTQQHNRDSTVRSARDTVQLEFEDSNSLFANASPLRYSSPFFYGRFRDRALIYVFEPQENLRFTHSPSGGGTTQRGDDTNPAWDYQLIIPRPKKGHTYSLRGRLIYKRWRGRDDVLAEVTKYLSSLDASPATPPKPQTGDADFPRPSPSPRHDEKVAAVKSGNYDLVLIGDSITHSVGELGGKYEPMKAVWQRHFAPYRAINLGHNGYRTEQILWNLANGELDFARSPKVVLLLIGTNNADDRHFAKVHSAEQIFAGTKAIVKLIQTRHPTTKILILRIFPRGGDDQQGVSPPIFHSSDQCIETCRRAGELTRQLADEQQVFWLDVNHVFFNANGTINTERMWDLLHPSPAGADAWAAAVQPTLEKLLHDQATE